MLDRGRASSWDRFGSQEEFERELLELMPYAPLARTVFELRAQRGLTQQQLADRIGTTQSVIARLESGEHEVRIGVLNRIADALGLHWRVVFEDPKATATLEQTSFVPAVPLRITLVRTQSLVYTQRRSQRASSPLRGRGQSALALAS
jgi:transcriptional regulator with XRE-family HTH domain